MGSPDVVSLREGLGTSDGPTVTCIVEMNLAGNQTGTGRLTMYYDSAEELGRLACFLKCLFFLLCPNARQPGKVLNT